MQIILLSGGSGKRLWPLSNDTRSKQFLKVLKAEDGSCQSMVQRMYHQIEKANLDANILVATGSGQLESIRCQLPPQVEVITEPERRNTFPAIALATAYLSYEKQLPDNETIVVLPVDPYTEQRYFETLHTMDEAVKQQCAKLVLMGIVPTYPSEKYGYIVPKEGTSDAEVTMVSHYVEKPSEQEAEALILRHAVWNGGVFAFQLGYMKQILKSYIMEESYTRVREQYATLPRISFDYEVSEKESSIAYVSYEGKWKDLGTWNTLTEEMQDDIIGRGMLADTCENTHVINELEIPVIAMGLKDCVVVVGTDGILVSDKHQSSYLKPLAEQYNERPMCGEYHWGNYRVLHYETLSDQKKTLTKIVSIYRGEHIGLQSHRMREETWNIIDGSGELILENQKRNIQRGESFMISSGETYDLIAETEIKAIVIQSGEEVTEEDIVQYEK